MASNTTRSRCEEVEEWFKRQQHKREAALARKEAKLLLLEEDTVALVASEASYSKITTKKRCMLRLGKLKNIKGLGRAVLDKCSLLGNSVSYSACPDDYMKPSSSSSKSYLPTEDDTAYSASTLNTAKTSSSSISDSSSGSQDGRENSPLLEFDDKNVVDSSYRSSSSISLTSSVLDDSLDDDDDSTTTDNITVDDDINDHNTTTTTHHLVIVCGMKYIYDSTYQDRQLGYYTGQIRAKSKLPHGIGTWRDVLSRVVAPRIRAITCMLSNDKCVIRSMSTIPPSQ